VREPPTPTEDLVKSIVDALKPWRDEYKNSEMKIRAAIREQIKLLASVTPDFLERDKIRKTRADARKIAATIQKLQEQIKRAAPELRLHMGLDIPGTWGPFRTVQVGPHPLQRELERARENCEVAKHQPGWDPITRVCAQIGVGLIRKYSATPPTGGRKGALRQIFSLLF
jgi:hypothetical protein